MARLMLNTIVKKIIVILVICALLCFGFVWLVLWNVKNCEPRYLHFAIYFQTSKTDQNSSILTDYDNSKNGDWSDKDRNSFTDESNIRIWVKKSIPNFNMNIVEDFASCDANDSYVHLNPKKVEATLNEQKLFSDNSSQSLNIDYQFQNTEKTNEEYTLDLSYKGAFKTKRHIHIFWLNEEDFDLQKSKIPN
jgi:hypothetical protein